MLLENCITSSAIFAHQAIFSTLYTGKPSGKQDWGLFYGLSRKSLLEFKKCILDISWKLVRLDLYSCYYRSPVLGDYRSVHVMGMSSTDEDVVLWWSMFSE